MKPAVFLTGATGFLGMEVLARLLERGDREVLALVRAPTTTPRAEARLDGVLRHAVATTRRRTATRVRAVAGDAHAARPRASAPAATSSPSASARCCTARPRSRSTCRSTRRARSTSTARARCSASRARRRRAARSSASCTSRPPTSRGRHAGAFRERQLDAGQAFRNTYEQTKCEAEQLVGDGRATSAPAIARPSIVDGRVATRGWTPAFNVLYWPLRAFARGLFDEVPALPDGRVDIVPVDYVADALVHLLDRREAGVFNLVAGRDAATVDELAELACDALRPAAAAVRRAGRPAARRPTSTAPSTCPYFDMEVVFDDTRARAVLGRRASSAPPLRDYFGDAHGLRRGRALGQAGDDARGRSRAPRGARGDVSSKPHEPGYSAKRNRGE